MSIPVSRRDLLAGAFALAGRQSLSSKPRVALPDAAKLVPNGPGGYLYVPGIDFFSFGALAAPGFEIVRATFRRSPRFPEGLSSVEAHLRAAGRPIQALCGFEFRSGHQATMPEFMGFNNAYIEILRKAGVLVNGQMPLARTNMALPCTEDAHRIHAFTYTVPMPSRSSSRPTFMLTGIPDVRNLGPNAEIVAKDDISADGLRQKTVFVLDSIEGLLTTMGANWNDVTGLQLYTARDLHPILAKSLLPKIGEAASRGIQWHYALLPVAGGDVEIDARSVRMELAIAA